MALMENKPKVVIQRILFQNPQFTINSFASAPQKHQFSDQGAPNCGKSSVLIERSPFFASRMDRDGFMEANRKEIDIEYDVEVTVFEDVIDYVHNGEIVVSSGNLEEIIRAATYLQLDNLFKFCRDVLKSNILGKLYETLSDQTVQEVESELSNWICIARVYNGTYLLGYDRSDQIYFLHYCPEIGRRTSLKAPNGNIRKAQLVVNSDDIYMVRCGERGHNGLEIQIQKYDGLKNTWTSATSKHIGYNVVVSYPISVSYCLDQILVFIFCTGRNWGRMTSCWIYYVKSDSWDNEADVMNADQMMFKSSASYGGQIYMPLITIKPGVLQYTPSTKTSIEIPCGESVDFHVALVYKSKILFLPIFIFEPSIRTTTMTAFNTFTKQFQYYSFHGIYKANNLGREGDPLSFTLFDESVYLFDHNFNRVMKLDLSFLDEEKEPTLIPLSDWKIPICNVSSITSIESNV